MLSLPHNLQLVDKVEKNIGVHLQGAPLVQSVKLKEKIGADVTLKIESLQKTGSFKMRGALGFFSQIKESGYAGEVVTASDSNMAFAFALAAKIYDRPARIFVSGKIEDEALKTLETYDVAIEKQGSNPDDSQQKARQYCKENDFQFMSPSDNAYLLAGIGISAKEVLAKFPDDKSLGTVVLPIGSGGLAVAVGGLIKQERPNCSIVGVQQENLCDGPPSDKTADILDSVVDEVIDVSNSSIKKAISFLFHEHHIVVESAGALATAALIENKVSVHGRHVLAYVTGGNIASTRLTQLLINKDSAL